MPKTSILVCRKCSGSKALLAYLHEHTDARIREVGCQKICKQPVAAMRIDGSLQWFEGLKEGKHRRALAELAVDGGPDLPKVLRKAAVHKKKG